MTSRGDKIAYNSSNIYQNPLMFVFLRKGSRTPIPTITVAAKGWFSGISIIYCDFDNGRLSIKRATDNDNDVVPYLKVTGDGYKFFKLVGDNGPIISNLKKGKTVKLSIEDNAYKSSKSIEAEKNISLRGSTSAINYALGIKTNPSSTNSISDNYYWVELLESQNLRKVYDSQFVSFFMSNYSYIKKIRVFDNSKIGKYSFYYNNRVLNIPTSKVDEINRRFRQLGLKGRNALVKTYPSQSQETQQKPTKKPSISQPPKQRPKVNNSSGNQNIFLVLIIVLAALVLFFINSKKDKKNDVVTSNIKNKKPDKPKPEIKDKTPVTRGKPDIKKEIDMNSIPWNANGSGLILSKDGYIATNAHVVTSEEKTVKNIGVEFNYKDEIKTFKAKVVKTDFVNDLAVIKIDDKSFKGIAEIPFSIKNDEAELGEEVFALGYPLALNLMGTDIKFTDGRISSKTGFRGNISTYQSSAPIQPGSSGGPLFDFNGNLLGINSSGLAKEIADNVSYTIKTSYLNTLLNVLPKKITLPRKNSLEGLSDTEKIKILTKYVALIKIELV